MTHESCILNVGDIAVVKSYEDLVAEFGVNKDGDVKVAPSWEFPFSDRDVCGKTVKIVNVEYHGVVGNLSDFYAYDVIDAHTGYELGTCLTSYDLTHIIPPSPDDCSDNDMKNLFQE